MPQSTPIKVLDSAPVDQKGEELPQSMRVIDQSAPSGFDPDLFLEDEGIRTLESVNPFTNFANAFQKELISGTASDFAELLSGVGGFEGHEKSIELQESAEERLPTRGGVSEFLGRSIAGVTPFLPALAAPILSIPVLAIYGLRAMGQGRGAVKAHEEITGEDIAGTTEAAVAAGYGIAVFMSEAVGLRNFRWAIDKLAPSALRRIAQSYSTGSAKRTAKTVLGEIARVPGTGALREARQEGVEKSITNIIDMSYGAKNIGDLFQGVPEAAAAGAVGGGLIGGLGLGVQAKNIKQELRRTGANRQVASDFPNLEFDQVNEVSSLINAVASVRGANPKDIYNEFQNKSEIVDATKTFRTSVRKGSVNTFIRDTLPLFKQSVSQETFQEIETSLKVKESGNWTSKEAGSFNKVLRSYMDDSVVKEGFSEDALVAYQNWLAATAAHALETTLLHDGKPAVITFIDDAFSNSNFEPQDAINLQRVENRKTLRDRYNEFINMFDVENRFKDAPELGIAVKSQFSVQDAIEGKTEHTVARAARSLMRARYTQEEIADLRQTLPMIIEDTKVFDKLPRDQKQRLQPTIDIVQEYFNDALQVYKDEGALEQGFFEEMRTRIESERIKAKETGNAEQYRKLEEKLSKIEEASFVPIPFRLWFEKLAVTNPRKATRVMALLGTKKRKTLFIRDLLQKKVISKDDIDIFQIMGYYGRRLGKDTAILRIKNAGLNAGFIKPLEKGQRPDRFNGFVRPPSNAPILKGFQIKNVLSDYMMSASKYHDSMALVDKGLSITKMGQFINPLFLPVYDLWQAAMVGSINPLRPVRTFKNIQRAVSDFRDQGEPWMAAGIHGARSTPYVNPLARYDAYIQQVAKHPNPLIRATMGILSQDILRQTYNTSWKTAWALDGFVRQITYRHLTDNMGFKPADAGRITALYHADYAGIPSSTRKKLNRIFFTPSFKIAMTKLYTRMVRDSINVSIKAGGNIIKGRRIGENITQEEKIMMGGLGRTLGIVMTMDILMTSFLGFERDEWGRRYTKEVETVEGKKDLVITYGAPFNMFLKYFFRMKESFFDPSVTGKLQTFFQKNSWELHPVWRMINGFLRNRRPDGRQIYEKFTGEGTTQIASYFLSQSAALVDEVLTSVAQEPEKVEMQKLLNEELGKAGTLFANWFAFAYLRGISDEVAARRSQMLLNELNNEVKFIIERRGKVSQKYIEEATERVSDRIREIQKRASEKRE